MLAECSNWWNNYIWDILLANIGEHIPAPWSIWVKITFKIHRNLKEAMKTRVKWWDGIEHGSIAMTTGYNGEIIVNMWGFTSKIWPILDIPLNCFTSSDPHPDTLFWRSFWHTIWTYVLVCIYIYTVYIQILTFFLAYTLTLDLTLFLAFSLACVWVPAWPTAGRELAIWCWGPGEAHRKWGSEAWVAPLLKSRDPHWVGGQKYWAIRTVYRHPYTYYIYILYCNIYIYAYTCIHIILKYPKLPCVP